MDRELDRYPACIADAIARTLSKVDMDPVAGRQITARLGDADDRLAAAQFLGCDTIIHEPLEIEGGHVHAFVVIEPVARAQSALAVLLGHSRLSGLLKEDARLGPASELRLTNL